MASFDKLILTTIISLAIIALAGFTILQAGSRLERLDYLAAGCSKAQITTGSYSTTWVCPGKVGQ